MNILTLKKQQLSYETMDCSSAKKIFSSDQLHRKLSKTWNEILNWKGPQVLKKQRKEGRAPQKYENYNSLKTFTNIGILLLKKNTSPNGSFKGTNSKL